MAEKPACYHAYDDFLVYSGPVFDRKSVFGAFGDRDRPFGCASDIRNRDGFTPLGDFFARPEAVAAWSRDPGTLYRLLFFKAAYGGENYGEPGRAFGTGIASVDVCRIQAVWDHRLSSGADRLFDY